MTQTITNARRRLSIEEEEAARGFISSIFNFSVFHHKKRMERGAFLVVWQWRTDEDGNCDEIIKTFLENLSPRLKAICGDYLRRVEQVNPLIIAAAPDVMFGR